MNLFLTSNEWQWRQLRTVVQGVLGVVVANVGLLMGLGQFVTTFVITMWYVSFANKKLDPISTEIRTELEAQEAGR